MPPSKSIGTRAYGIVLLVLWSFPGASFPGAMSQNSSKLSIEGLLKQKAYAQMGRSLAARGKLSRKEVHLLTALSPQAFEQVYLSYAKNLKKTQRRSENLLGKLMRGLHQRANKNLPAAIQSLFPLMDYRPWLVPLAGLLGKMAIRLSRRGNASGLPILKKIAGLWKGQAFASANLALALRLLGHYSKADRIYKQAARESRRAPWLLNNWGLCREAMGDREGALRLFLEGSRSDSHPNSHTEKGLAPPQNLRDRATCQANAAFLLEARGRLGDLSRAISLLERAVSLAPDRIRPRYYLYVFRKERSDPGHQPD